MDKWAELRTAYVVAKLGTVSAAAETLGFHRATVNRHIDILEEELGARVFIRHARGYALTELGEDTLRIAQKTEELIDDLAGRARVKKSQIEGELILSILSPFSQLIIESLANFRNKNPQCQVLISSTEDLARLERGEAHIAIRAGPKPEYADYIVQAYRRIRFTLYAHDSYIQRMGRPDGINDLHQHQFVIPHPKEGPRLFRAWLREHVQQNQIALCSSDFLICNQAIAAGLGLGFLGDQDVLGRKDFHQILPFNEKWTVPLWLVTHVDLHHTAKVQEMLSCLKAG